MVFILYGINAVSVTGINTILNKTILGRFLVDSRQTRNLERVILKLIHAYNENEIDLTSLMKIKVLRIIAYRFYFKLERFLHIFQNPKYKQFRLK